LPEYYFDIETYGRGVQPDPVNDKIITASYQRINIVTGEPIDDLVILREWGEGYSEERIVKEIYGTFFESRTMWSFVPVGFNLMFEWQFLDEKFKKYLHKKLDFKEFCVPQIDLKHVAVLLNKGYFKGCGLDTFTKKVSGVAVKEHYENRRYQEIEKYIELEAEEFLKFYKYVLASLSELGSKIRLQRG